MFKSQPLYIFLNFLTMLFLSSILCYVIVSNILFLSCKYEYIYIHTYIDAYYFYIWCLCKAYEVQLENYLNTVPTVIYSEIKMGQYMWAMNKKDQHITFMFRTHTLTHGWLNVHVHTQSNKIHCMLLNVIRWRQWY